MPERLWIVVASNGLLRVAGGASSVLVGVYLADLSRRGLGVTVGFVGILAAISYAAELLGSVPMGLLADALPTRTLMAGGAVLAAAATALFGATHQVSLLVASRVLEGFAAAASVPALLAHLTDATTDDDALRKRAMSYFELSLLVGLAFGGLLGSRLWAGLGTTAFVALAGIYLVAAALMYVGGAAGLSSRSESVWGGLRRALSTSALRHLAPIWLCMNTIVGLWLGPTLYFLLTAPSHGDQLLPGLLADDPTRLGPLMLVYASVFGVGLIGWSVALPHMSASRALRVALVAMLAVSGGLLALNHMRGTSLALRWALTALVALSIMVESGFTPAALSMLATAVGPGPGRGAAMGIYSLLLGLGALVGSLLGGALGNRFAIDGLIYATLGLAAIALGLLRWLPTSSSVNVGANV